MECDKLLLVIRLFVLDNEQKNTTARTFFMRSKTPKK